MPGKQKEDTDNPSWTYLCRPCRIGGWPYRGPVVGLPAEKLPDHHHHPRRQAVQWRQSAGSSWQRQPSPAPGNSGTSTAVVHANGVTCSWEPTAPICSRLLHHHRLVERFPRIGSCWTRWSDQGRKCSGKSPRGILGGVQAGRGQSHLARRKRPGLSAWRSASYAGPSSRERWAHRRAGLCCSSRWVPLGILSWSRISGLSCQVAACESTYEEAACRILWTLCQENLICKREVEAVNINDSEILQIYFLRATFPGRIDRLI